MSAKLAHQALFQSNIQLESEHIQENIDLNHFNNFIGNKRLRLSNEENTIKDKAEFIYTNSEYQNNIDNEFIKHIVEQNTKLTEIINLLHEKVDTQSEMINSLNEKVDSLTLNMNQIIKVTDIRSQYDDQKAEIIEEEKAEEENYNPGGKYDGFYT